MAADKKDGLDIAVVMGGPKGPPVAKDEPSYEAGEMPEEYLAAFRDYQRNPSAETMWDMIEACVNAGKLGSDKRMKQNAKPYD